MFVPPEDTKGMLGGIYKGVPEFRKRERKVKALRKGRESLQGMADKDTPLGAVSQGSHGGMYSIQGSYIPNYSGLANKAIGALGGAYADRKGGPLEKAESEYDVQQADQLLKSSEYLDALARLRRKSGYSY